MKQIPQYFGDQEMARMIEAERQRKAAELSPEQSNQVRGSITVSYQSGQTHIPGNRKGSSEFHDIPAATNRTAVVRPTEKEDIYREHPAHYDIGFGKEQVNGFPLSPAQNAAKQEREDSRRQAKIEGAKALLRSEGIEVVTPAKVSEVIPAKAKLGAYNIPAPSNREGTPTGISKPIPGDKESYDLGS